MNAIFLIFIGTIVRFSYFGGSDKLVETETVNEITGAKTITHTKVTEYERFWFYFTTLTVLPALIALYVIVEFNISAKISKNFNFLQHYIGKGTYFLMLAFMLLEKLNPVEVIFAIAIVVIFAINILAQFKAPKKGLEGEETDEENMRLSVNSHSHITKKDHAIGAAIEPDVMDEILKARDRKSTIAAKQRLESKGKAAVTEKSQAVKGKSGSGTMSASMQLKSGKPMSAESDP